MPSGLLKGQPGDVVVPCAVATISFPPSALRLDDSVVVQASVGSIPAEPQLVRYPRAIHLSGFRQVYPGGATTGPLPSGHPPFRLPSGLSRRSHNWSATLGPSTFQASVGFIPAEPQLVRYPRAIHLSGFRRVYPGGATTGRLPAHYDTPSVESSTCHHTGTPARPNQAVSCFGLGGAPSCLWTPASASTLRISSAVASQCSVHWD